MLRKQLASASLSCNVAQAARQAVGPLRASTVRLMFQNQNVQNQWTNDNVSFAGRRSDYDFDKERWAKQMKFASMDCIMEPSIVAPKYTSFEGIKKNIRRYMNMKKLTERRPGFHTNDLKELYIRYKYLLQSTDSTDSALLLRLTTHTEATRIEKDIGKRSNESFKNKSWGSMKLNMSKTAAPARKVGAVGSAVDQKKAKLDKAAEAAATASANGDSVLASAASHANDVVLSIRKPANYDIQVTDFQLVTSYMAQMAAEDWLQLTFKIEYYEKDTADAASSSDIPPNSSAPADAKEDKASLEKELTAKGYTKVVEYPCYELRMGDSASGGVQYPFIVLGVMRRDGTRYGRDAQDAAQLRKQFDRNRSWFS